MEAVRERDASGPVLYNGPIETGIRSLIVLDALHPRGYDLTALTWFDHIVVHSAEMGGPVSLHVPVAPKDLELAVRRGLIEDGLRLMQRVHLVEERYSDEGIQYAASGNAPAFLELMEAPYSDALKVRARWIATTFAAYHRSEIEALINERLNRWSIEFGPVERPR